MAITNEILKLTCAPRWKRLDVKSVTLLNTRGASNLKMSFTGLSPLFFQLIHPWSKHLKLQIIDIMKGIMKYLNFDWMTENEILPYVPTVLVLMSPKDPSVSIPWFCLSHRYVLSLSMPELPFKSGGGDEYNKLPPRM